MRFVFTFILVAAVFFSAVQVILAQHQARRTFVEVQKLEKMRDELNEEWGRLQLEQSTWATADRIERIAINKLEMVSPDTDSIILLKQ